MGVERGSDALHERAALLADGDPAAADAQHAGFVNRKARSEDILVRSTSVTGILQPAPAVTLRAISRPSGRGQGGTNSSLHGLWGYASFQSGPTGYSPYAAGKSS